MNEPAEARSTYTYGDSSVAGERLAVLASIFGPTTASFLRRDGDPGVDLAIDLGCGPGYTTAQVHSIIHPAVTVGLERSEAFVLRARVEHVASIGPALRFDVHDVTDTPFPTGPADLLFARYLLAHLPDPVAVRDLWLTQLRPEGRLLVEEIDHIDISIPTFERYFEVVEAMSAGHDTELLVGSTIAGAAPSPDFRLVDDSLVSITPDPRAVARIFAMNLSVWRHDPWITSNVPPATVEALADDLADLSDAAPASGITWHHRQLAYRRT